MNGRAPRVCKISPSSRRTKLETDLWAGPAELILRLSQYGGLRGVELEGGTRPYQFVFYPSGRFEQGRKSPGTAARPAGQGAGTVSTRCVT